MPGGTGNSRLTGPLNLRKGRKQKLTESFSAASEGQFAGELIQGDSMGLKFITHSSAQLRRCKLTRVSNFGVS